MVTAATLIRLTGAAFAVVAMLAPTASFAQWQVGGVQVASSLSNPHDLDVATDALSNTVIVWTDGRHHVPAIYAQRLDSDGREQWISEGVPVYIGYIGAGGKPRVVFDAHGGCIVAWIVGNHVLAQRLNPGGIPQWSLPGITLGAVDSTLGSSISNLALIPDGAGGAIALWSDLAFNAQPQIGGQHVSEAGTVSWSVAPTALLANRVLGWAAGAGTDGVVFVSFGSNSLGQPAIYVSKVTPAGTLPWGSGVLLSANPYIDKLDLWDWDGGASSPVEQFGCVATQVAPDGFGGALCAWSEASAAQPHTSAHEVKAAHVGSDGTMAWGPIGLGADPGVLFGPTYQGPDEFALYSETPTLVTDGAGGAIIAWRDRRFSYDGDIYIQHLDLTGSPAWGPGGRFVTIRNTRQAFPILVPDRSGGAMCLWQQNIYGQHMNAQGISQWPMDGVQLAYTNPTLLDEIHAVPDNVGGAIVVWSGNQPYAQAPHYLAGIDYSFTDGLHVLHVTGAGTTTGTLVSLYETSSEPGHVHLSWYSGTGAGFRASAYRRSSSEDWRGLRDVESDGDGLITLDDFDVTSAGDYVYRLEYQSAQGTLTTPEVHVHVPSAEDHLFGMGSPTPNPASTGVINVSFDLPASGDGQLAMFDISGRKLSSHSLGTYGAGHHLIALARGQDLGPGIYYVRLSYGGKAITRKLAVIAR